MSYAEAKQARPVRKAYRNTQQASIWNCCYDRGMILLQAFQVYLCLQSSSLAWMSLWSLLRLWSLLSGLQIVRSSRRRTKFTHRASCSCSIQWSNGAALPQIKAFQYAVLPSTAEKTVHCWNATCINARGSGGNWGEEPAFCKIQPAHMTSPCKLLNPLCTLWNAACIDARNWLRFEARKLPSSRLSPACQHSLQTLDMLSTLRNAACLDARGLAEIWGEKTASCKTQPAHINKSKEKAFSKGDPAQIITPCKFWNCCAWWKVPQPLTSELWVKAGLRRLPCSNSTHTHTGLANDGHAVLTMLHAMTPRKHGSKYSSEMPSARFDGRCCANWLTVCLAFWVSPLCRASCRYSDHIIRWCHPTIWGNYSIIPFIRHAC